MLKSIITKLKSSLSKTSSYLGSGIKNIFSGKKIDTKTLQDLEDLLISTDMGLAASEEIIKNVSSLKVKKDVTTKEVMIKIAEKVKEIISVVQQDFVYLDKKPQVIVFCGINGNGKTTTIGKLAHKFKKEGKKVMIAACDTFRAAAIEQLQIWAQRVNCDFFSDQDIKDPASVAYKAFKYAVQQEVDILMIDTAGRLHTQKNLMDQLKKICSVIAKLEPSAPHNVMLALDATTGQNALNQIRVFKDAVSIGGLVVTKTDGTAKGGIVVAIAKQYPDISISFVGTGEAIDDIEPFCPTKFSQGLLGLFDD